jgi:hypothetical protein
MAALTVCLSLCAVAEAHHSFSAQYDSRNRQKITGLITKVEWRNPHIYFYMDVTGADGKVTPWQLELASVQAMVGRGFTKDKLNVGDTVTVEGFRARDDSPLLDVRSIDRTATGEHLLAGRTIQ